MEVIGMSAYGIPSYSAAFAAARLLGVNTNVITSSLERLSSGLRINRAADDPAGLKFAESLQAQLRGLNRAATNALDGVSIEIQAGEFMPSWALPARARAR